MIIYSIYLSLYDLFHHAEYSLSPSMLLQLAKFHFLWPNSILLGEGNGTPLQYSCLENPMDRGAW